MLADKGRRNFVQAQVLRGVVIMFSRIIPLDEVPSQHALWLRAEAFGARCTATTDEAVTHLVTNTQHTLKVKAKPCVGALGRMLWPHQRIVSPAALPAYIWSFVIMVGCFGSIQAQWARETGKFVVNEGW